MTVTHEVASEDLPAHRFCPENCGVSFNVNEVNYLSTFEQHMLDHRPQNFHHSPYVHCHVVNCTATFRTTLDLSKHLDIHKMIKWYFGCTYRPKCFNSRARVWPQGCKEPTPYALYYLRAPPPEFQPCLHRDR
jgi:hypothetical protein